MNTPNILLIGCGPHAKRVYLPNLKDAEKTFGVKLKIVIELKEKIIETKNTVKKFFNDVKYVFVDDFDCEHLHSLPKELENKLNNLIKSEKINGVIIATNPLNHMQYALWAESKGLHILMDKPISTYDNICNSIEQTKQLKLDYDLLVQNLQKDKAFIINAQRRFLPEFEIVQQKINEIANKYGTPITSMQSTHSDGQWRLPNEVLNIKYHPLIGWGKVSHSGYHFIDMSSKLVKDSFIFSGKTFDEISVFSKFIRPSGVLKSQNQHDLKKIFGEEYTTLDSRSDEELLNLYRVNNEAEVDATSLISLSENDIPITNITLNLIHNGFSRRSWMLPNQNDLYKGNGRVRHEYHNIQQGCLQNIQIHSYQSSDKHNVINDETSFDLGGNNHYDIYIFRNSNITSGKTLEKITAKDVSKENLLDKTKLMNELARKEAIKEFLEVITKKRKATQTKSYILDHKLSVLLMSMIYESNIKKAEIIHKIKLR